MLIVGLILIPTALVAHLALSMIPTPQWMPGFMRVYLFRSCLNRDFGFLLNLEDFEVTNIWSQYLCFGGAYGSVVAVYKGDEILNRETMQTKITSICEARGWALAEDSAEYLGFFRGQLLERFPEHVSAESSSSSLGHLVFEKRPDDWDEEHGWKKYEIVAGIAEDCHTVVFYCDRGR